MLVIYLCLISEYGQVTHLQAVTEHIEPEDDQPRMRLMLSWQHPVINTTHFPLPSTYYLALVDKNSSYSETECGDNPLCFKTNGTVSTTIGQPTESMDQSIYGLSYICSWSKSSITSKMVYHRGASLSEHALLILCFS